MAALRKFLAAFLVAAFICVGLPSLPMAGGSDDPGYVGGGNKDDDSGNDAARPRVPTDGPTRSCKDLTERSDGPEEPSGFLMQFAKSWLQELLSVLVIR